jgi:hypothetical protein
LFWLWNVGLGQIPQVVEMESRKLNPKKCSNFFFVERKRVLSTVKKYFRRYYKKISACVIIILWKLKKIFPKFPPKQG